MLISFDEINEILKKYNIVITGAFHIGAHECEELGFYDRVGITHEDIIWVEALDFKVKEAINRKIPNVYHAVITDKDDDNIVFNISNNYQSSSVLDLCTHSIQHPSVVYIDSFNMKSITIDTFFERNNIKEPEKYNFWNFDIQGAELMALKGGINSIKHVKAIYLEVNEEELYKNCGIIEDIDEFLLNYGFKRILTNMTQNHWGDALYIFS